MIIAHLVAATCCLHHTRDVDLRLIALDVAVAVTNDEDEHEDDAGGARQCVDVDLIIVGANIVPILNRRRIGLRESRREREKKNHKSLSKKV